MITSKSKGAKGILGALRSWERINRNYITRIEKEMLALDERMNNSKHFLVEIQKRFVKIFQRDNTVAMKLVKFVENYTRFVNDHPLIYKPTEQKKPEMLSQSFFNKNTSFKFQRQDNESESKRSRVTSQNSINSPMLKMTRGRFRQEVNKKKQMFVKENHPKMIKMILEKLDNLHDSVWQIIEEKKEKAVSEKKRFLERNQLNKDIDFLLASFLTMVGLEVNKLGFIKKFVTHFIAWRDEMKESELEFPVKSIELTQTSLPPIDYRSSVIPQERIDYIFEKAMEFVEGMQNSLESRKNYLPQEMVEVLNKEIKTGARRVTSLRIFIIGQIRLLKVRYTLFVHRLEDWMINSIREENAIVYDFIKYIRKSVKEGAPTLEMNNKSYEPTELNPVIKFDTEPDTFNFPEEEYQLEHIPSLSQIYLILCDLFNLSGVKDRFQAVLKIEDLSDHFISRVKKSLKGYMDYFPETWLRITPAQFRKCFSMISIPVSNSKQQDSDCVKLDTLCLSLILLRYPLPSFNEVGLLEKAFRGRNLSQEEFEMQACWMDKFEERLIDGLDPKTPYKTIFTKRLIWWLFNNQDRFLSDRYLEILERFSTENDVGMFTFYDKIFGHLSTEEF